MNTNNHTPGPWVARTGPSTDLIVEVDSPDTFPPMIATVSKWHESGHHEEARANARLIAAAPELLTALENILAANPDLAEVADEARSAIAKAKGEKQ